MGNPCQLTVCRNVPPFWLQNGYSFAMQILHLFVRRTKKYTKIGKKENQTLCSASIASNQQIVKLYYMNIHTYRHALCLKCSVTDKCLLSLPRYKLASMVFCASGPLIFGPTRRSNVAWTVMSHVRIAVRTFTIRVPRREDSFRDTSLLLHE